jgi:hypothetical protein
MLLRLRRSQRQGGFGGGKIFFALDAKVEVAPEEWALIDKYRLGDLSIYDSEARKLATQGAQLGFAAGQNMTGSAGRQFAGLAKGLANVAIAAFTLRVTVSSLVGGQKIECKSMEELLGAENAIREACVNLKGYIETALTFDGREEVIEF